jgi:hypothetical protein
VVEEISTFEGSEKKCQYFHKKRMVRPKKNGVGAVCSVLIRYLHPSIEVNTKYPRARYADRLEGLIVQRRQVKKLNHRDQTVVVFRHDDFPNLLVYCAERYAKVVECGDPCDYFDGETIEPLTPRTTAEVVVEAYVDTSHDENLMAVPVLNTNQEVREQITTLLSEGYEVDDDNDPAPENVPDRGRQREEVDGLSWLPYNSRTTCNRQASGHRYENPKMINQPNASSCLDYFFYFLPRHVKEVILVETNKQLEGRDATWGEFVIYMGLWLLMSTISNGCSRKQFWDEQPPSEWSGAPYRLHNYMSKTRFENITKALRYSNTPAPTYVDKFSEVRDMIKAWNTHMEEVFIPSWMSCLDESMSSWTRRWTCPGFMYVPRKPHPMGNEYHSICCGVSGIMFAIELVEGKDAPQN